MCPNPLNRRFFCESLEQRQLLSAGLLDTSFNATGHNTITISNLTFNAHAVAVQTDGKVVVVGDSTNTSLGSTAVPQMTVARFNADGSVDTTFGPTHVGVAVTTSQYGGSFAAVAIQSDGSIVAVGTVSYALPYVQIVRYLPTGAPDTDFANQGSYYLSDFGDNTAYFSASAVAIQKDGKIVVAGSAHRGIVIERDNFAVARLNTDGTLDDSFNGGGTQAMDFGDNTDAHAMTIDYAGTAATNPDYGKIIVVGSIHPDDGSDYQFAIDRLTTSGDEDGSFGNSGQVVSRYVSEDKYSNARVVVVQANNEIVIAGDVGATPTGSHDFGVFRLYSNGTGDSTFGASNGQTTIDFGGNDAPFSMTIGQTGNLLIGGTSSGLMAIADLTSDGLLDPVFGTGGKVVHGFSTGAEGIAPSSGGTFVAAGGPGFATARFFDRGFATVSITTFTPTMYEAGATSASFEILQKETRTLDTDVYYSPGGTASSPAVLPRTNADYTGISSSVINWFADIVPGQNYALVTLTAIDDTRPEADETVTFTLKDFPGKYDVVSPSSATITIIDNDGQRVSGNVYKDANGNGTRDVGETGLPGVEMYLDANGNGALDTGEKTAFTDSSGNYLMTSVPVGLYTLRQVVPSGYSQTSPGSNAGIAINMTTGANFTSKTFGDKAVTTDPTSVTLQAESATLAGGTVASSANAGFTGSGYADYGGNGSSVQWTTTRVAAGAVTLVFRYANGGTTNRPLSIVVNGATVGSVACVPTGSWTTWSTVSINANLVAGSNTVKATASTSTGGANVDSLTINKNTMPPVITYQGESATLAGGTVASTANSGYTGTGYADFGGANSSATFTATRTSAGSATLTFRYANGSTANRPLSVSVNGTVVGSVSFAPTGSWTTWKTVTLVVNLLGGNNTIKLVVTGTNGPNLDWMSVG
jgi:uncharacterized delta-60 repeat protein